MSGFFSKSRITAQPGYSRWLAPPSALSVHLCIGQAYAFSVFNAPLTRVLGVTSSTPEDWKLTTLGWIFSLAIVLVVEAVYLILARNPSVATIIPPTEATNTVDAIRELGMALFSQYLLPFEVTSILLLVAMVGAIVLTKPEKKGERE